MKQDTLNLNAIASLIKYQHPDMKLKDINATLKATEEVLSYGLETGQKIKFGKLFIIEPVIRKGQRHFNGIAKNPGYVQLPNRLRFKFRTLKKLKKIEDDYHPRG